MTPLRKYIPLSAGNDPKRPRSERSLRVRQTKYATSYASEALGEHKAKEDTVKA